MGNWRQQKGNYEMAESGIGLGGRKNESQSSKTRNT